MDFACSAVFQHHYRTVAVGLNGVNGFNGLNGLNELFNNLKY